MTSAKIVDERAYWIPLFSEYVEEEGNPYLLKLTFSSFSLAGQRQPGLYALRVKVTEDLGIYGSMEVTLSPSEIQWLLHVLETDDNKYVNSSIAQLDKNEQKVRCLSVKGYGGWDDLGTKKFKLTLENADLMTEYVVLPFEQKNFLMTVLKRCSDEMLASQMGSLQTS